MDQVSIRNAIGRGQASRAGSASDGPGASTNGGAGRRHLQPAVAAIRPGHARVAPAALAEHTHEHFAAEEELMKARSYPNFQPHMLRHRTLLAQLSILRTALAEQVLDWDHMKTMRLLRGWLIQHIHKCDRPFSTYLHMIEKHAG